MSNYYIGVVLMVYIIAILLCVYDYKETTKQIRINKQLNEKFKQDLFNTSMKRYYISTTIFLVLITIGLILTILG